MHPIGFTGSRAAMLTILHNPPHANFCRLLERDLERCFQFVEPNDAHAAVYSDEFARIIILACIEIENALRGFLASTGGSTSQKNLGDFHGVVTVSSTRRRNDFAQLIRWRLVTQGCCRSLKIDQRNGDLRIED